MERIMLIDAMNVDPEKIKELGMRILWERIKQAGTKRGVARGRVAVGRFRKMVKS